MPARDTAEVPTAAVSVGAASTTIVPANPDRLEVTICNADATSSDLLYLSLGGTAALNTGIRVNAQGGSFTIDTYTGAINGFATSASTPVTYSEI